MVDFNQAGRTAVRHRLLFICVSILFVWFPTMVRSEVPSEYKILSDSDLTDKFHTKGKWRLIVAQQPAENDEEFSQFLHFYFIKNDKPRCIKSEIFDAPCNPPDYSNHAVQRFNISAEVSIQEGGKLSNRSVLVIRASTGFGGSGQPITTMLWRYAYQRDTFELIFDSSVNPNTNEETRVVQSGPLTGYVVRALQGQKAPYGYHLTVYRPTKS